MLATGGRSLFQLCAMNEGGCSEKPSIMAVKKMKTQQQEFLGNKAFSDVSRSGFTGLLQYGFYPSAKA